MNNHWETIMRLAAADPVARGLVELRERLDAVPEPKALAPTAQGVTVDELNEILERSPAVAFRHAMFLAEHLLDHPRLGPLLRGEGAPVKRVELEEDPDIPQPPTPYAGSITWINAWSAGWAAARAEVARLQEGQS